MALRLWLRRTPVILALLAACAICATVTAEPAGAQAPPTDWFTDLRTNGTGSAKASDFFSKILDVSDRSKITGGTWTNAEKNIIYRQQFRAAGAARLTPALAPWALRLTLAGTAAYVGYRVYQHWHGGDTTNYDMWLDSGGLGKDSLLNPAAVPFGTHKSQLTWGNPDTGDCYENGVGACWEYSVTGGTYATDHNCVGLGAPCWILHVAPGMSASCLSGDVCQGPFGAEDWHCMVGYYWDSRSWCSSSLWDDDWIEAEGRRSTSGGDPGFFWTHTELGRDDQADAQAGYMAWQSMKHMSEQVDVDLVDAGSAWWLANGGDYPTEENTRYRLLLTEEQMADLLGSSWVPSADPGTDPDDTDDYTVPSTYEEPGDVGTDTDLDGALDVFDSPCGQSFVNWVLNGKVGTFTPTSCGGWTTIPTFRLYAPLVNETYSDYLDRLRAGGWLGTASDIEADEDIALPQMGPQGVARVKIGANTYTPGHWPSPAPRWNVNTNLIVWWNPEDTPDGDGDGETLPGDDPGPTTEDDTGPIPAPGDPTGALCPDCPDLDFTPITEADVGGKFPFGVITWCSGWVGAFAGDPVAPEFDFTNPTWGGAHYDVNLNVMDEYAAMIRTLLSWCIWIGAVWWFGSYLLGFRATGDPGAAVDDAW